MKALFTDIRQAVVSTLVLAVVCCGLYPLIVWGIAQIAFKDKANGSLILDRNGTVRGSALLGQGFTGEKYFSINDTGSFNSSYFKDVLLNRYVTSWMINGVYAYGSILGSRFGTQSIQLSGASLIKIS